jgi:hypothetical protein
MEPLQQPMLTEVAELKFEFIMTWELSNKGTQGTQGRQ